MLCNKLPESKSQGFPRAIGKNPPDRISKRGADGAPRPEDGAADVALRDHGHLCETWNQAEFMTLVMGNINYNPNSMARGSNN